MDQTERNIDIIKTGIRTQADELRKDLTGWIDRHTGPALPDHDPRAGRFRGPYVAINAALLETAIDRMLALHGGPDAREFVATAFEQRLEAYKRSLQ